MSDTLFIKNVRLIDGYGNHPIENTNVLIKNKKIAGIGMQFDNLLEDAQIIDGTNFTLMPGMIDSHVHAAMLTDNEVLLGATEEVITASTVRAVKNMERALMKGVTTVRDCGCRHMGIFSIRKSIESGIIKGPRMLLSGCGISSTGGHGPQVAVEADGEVEIQKVARKQLKAGAEWIKLMVTGGTATPGEETTDVQFTVKEIAAAVDEAHRRGKKVCAHVSCLEGAKAAIKGGVDTLEHGIVLDEETVKEMVRKNIYLVSTVCLTNREANAGTESGIPDFTRRKAAGAAGNQFKSFQLANQHNVKIVAGTDADGFFHPFGESMVWELEWLIKGGMSPLQAIHTATGLAAEMLGIDHEVGTIEYGKVGDLLLVEGNPLEDIRLIETNLKMVIKDGVIVALYDREAEAIVQSYSLS